MIMALQTADSVTRIWLLDSEDNHSHPNLEWESGRTLSEDLLGRINQLIESSNKSFEDLGGIIIFSGPGSFTSLRIGHTVANSLAHSLKIPIIGTRGDDWITQGFKELKLAKINEIAIPFYGSEANITKPKG